MTKKHPLPIHIVVGYDFSDSAQLALARGMELAEIIPQHMLHILTVLDGKFEPRTGLNHKIHYQRAAEVQQELTSAIESQLAHREPRSTINFFVHARIGNPDDELLRLAEEVGAHLVVVGSHGRTGIKRVLMGSVSERVVREAKCPVLVVRDREYEDVELATIVDAPEVTSGEATYIKPHCYSYFNALMQRQRSSWPWY